MVSRNVISRSLKQLQAMLKYWGFCHDTVTGGAGMTVGVLHIRSKKYIKFS